VARRETLHGSTENSFILDKVKEGLKPINKVEKSYEQQLEKFRLELEDIGQRASSRNQSRAPIVQDG
jgi:hypothetical protein